jgi:predicted DNA binding CopG/RHH family protein
MKKIKFDPFKNLVLDEYEQEIEDSLPENPEIIPIPPKRLRELQKAAELTLVRIKKTKNINLRLSEDTVSNLKIRAAQLGLRYQTLAGSVLHRYASGQTIVADSL